MAGEPTAAVKPPSQGAHNKGMPMPRPLRDQETFQDLTQWDVSVRVFYRKDEIMYPFVSPKLKWDSSKENYNLLKEHNDSKLKRDADEMAMDLVAFLQTMAGFIPGDHLRQQIVKETGCYEDVINLIREFYDAEINAESELNFMKIERKPQEPHRMFYERLSAHVREHLVGPNKSFGTITSGETGDKMTLSMQNLVFKIFLHKVNPKLADIVKKEYGPIIKTGKLLCELAPDICRNIENLLQRDANTSAVSRVQDGATASVCQITEDLSELTVEELEEREADSVNAIRKMYGNAKKKNNFSRGGHNQSRDRFRGSGQQSSGYKQQCHHCEYAKKAHNLALDSNHPSYKCPNKKVVVRLVVAEEKEGDDSFGDEGDQNNHSEPALINLIQSEERERRVPVLPDEYEDSPVIRFIQQPLRFTQNPELSELNKSQIAALQSRVRKVVRKSFVRKEKSPAFQAIVKGKILTATVDEGAEISIVSADLVRRANIPIIQTYEGANAADGGGLKVVGQTRSELVIHGYFQGVRVEINLGHVLVVENLEADLLMGEPGKKDNMLFTKSHEKKIFVVRDGVEYSTPYFKAGGGKQSYSVVKIVKTTELEPEEFIRVQVPDEMRNTKEVLITPRRGDVQWFRPMLRRVINGTVAIKNKSGRKIKVRRGRAIGEMRTCREARPSEVKRVKSEFTERETIPIWDINRINKVDAEGEDGFKYYNFAEKEEKKTSYLSSVQIDPDNQLSQSWREKFKDLLHGYDEVINPAPGKYNKHFGPVTTKINFTTVPPPTDKVYLPNYSKDMMEELATKMDSLIRWGVLVRAESIGVTVQHVSPCMLVPKGDGDGFRLVTDFSRLNTFIGKFPSVSPTIQDAKDAIAKKKYAVHLDLSNYFYQGGISKHDAQYLGVVHPYQGLFVYTCEGQGLKNASEHAYERLAVIFGDLVRQEKMTRHADGLHVLGDTVQELYDNLALVLERCKLAGLTLKPSKVIIAPVNSVLFGWRLEGHRWLPTEHTISALSQCDKPSTVKKMRSFIGAFKQFSDLVPGYAKLLHPLEMVAAGKESRETVEWTEDLEKVFAAAQEATKNLDAVSTPRPDDKLHTYSDYSEENRAVGGRMVIERKTDTGTQFLLAGHYSVILDKFKARWLPCEGEAAGIKAVLTYFKPWIIDNNGVVTHHTDNQPSVQAWKRLKRGAYSTSSRISSFLSELSQLSVELEYTPGKNMKTSDFASRNPPKCEKPETCQICRFAEELQTVGDDSSKIRRITIEDITAGKSILPLSQKGAWTDVQHKDSVHSKLLHLMEIGQSPNQHKTNGDNTKLKQLYGLFVKGDLILDKDGTVMVKTKDGAYSGYALSIPHGMFPGLVHTLHIRLGHPSKSQLSQLVQRYFYSPGHQRIISEVTDSCFQCCSLKPLPGVLIKDTTTRVETCGTNFSADVMEREGQKVLLVRENLTAFTWARLVEDQKADTLETCLLSMILPFTSSAGATVRTDGATAFQSLARREDSDLKRNNITLEVGRLNNENKNPQAENCVKEFEKEILRYDPDLKFLKEINIISILKAMNSRIRHQGKSSQEMLMRRDMLENRNIEVEDKTLADKQQQNREKQSKYQEKFQSKFKKEAVEQDLKIGDFVFVRKQLGKHKARELHVIHDYKQVGKTKFFVVRKADNQLRSKTYLMLQQELVKAPIKNNLPDVDDQIKDSIQPAVTETRPRREAARKAREMFGRVLLVTDGGAHSTPADHNYSAQYESELALPRSVGDPSQVNMTFPERLSTNPVSFHVNEILMTPATSDKKRRVNPCINNPYGEDVYVDYSDVEVEAQNDDEEFLQRFIPPMQNPIEARQQVADQAHLENDFNHDDLEEEAADERNEEENIFNDLNAVSLTDRKDLSRELDILLQQGITPPALPPKGDTPAPDLPPKRSRVKSFKGSQFNNYAEAHSGRVRKFSNK